ncbi:MAG: hypothetical protein K2N75_00535, partial [Helicobacter sp.]|uniref:hypothetical protein n=1 Tax=Helicobacter sp. TaxID=218 RepID=UPI0023D1A9E5
DRLAWCNFQKNKTANIFLLRSPPPPPPFFVNSCFLQEYQRVFRASKCALSGVKSVVCRI